MKIVAQQADRRAHAVSPSAAGGSGSLVRRGTDGQGAIEYIAILLVVAVVVALCIAAFSGVDLGGRLSAVVDKIFSH